MLLCLATRFKMTIKQTDVKNFYLQARLPPDKVYYAEIPDGWAENDPKTHVAKVLAPWYGLKEAAKLSGDQFAKVLGEQCGMKQSINFPKLFYKWEGDDLVMCAQHSDDCIWATTNDRMLKDMITKVDSKFKLELTDKPTKILGCQIEYDQERGIMKLHQGEYMRSKFNELGYVATKKVGSPGEEPAKISNPLCEEQLKQATPDEVRRFQKEVGIMVWALQTDPSSAYSVKRIASGMVNPQPHHWNKLERLKRYRYHNADMGIIFRAANPPENLKRGHNLDCLTLYADADLAGDRTDSKSTSGYSVHFGDSGMFDWKSKKQTCVCQSSCESEILSNKLATCHAIWLRNGLTEIGFTFSKPTPVCQDNMSSIACCESDKHHSRSRHFRMHVHLLKDCLAKRITCYPWVPTKEMKGDLFNKYHQPGEHQRLCELNHVSNLSIDALPEKVNPSRVYGWKEQLERERLLAKDKPG